MIIVHWKSVITGKTGHGEPIEDKAALSWIKFLNKKYRNLMHWGQVC